MNVHGPYAPGTTVYDMFNTRDTDQAPITLAGTPSVRCYKNASDVQDDSGITLTVDFDGVTGMHHLAIDTSADATFYATDSEIFEKIEAGTVDAISVVGYIIGRFGLVTDGLTSAQQTAIRTAVGLATPNLDTQLGAIDDFLDTEIAAILADTNELQTDWANGGRLDLLVDSIIAKLGTTEPGAVPILGTSEIGALVAWLVMRTGMAKRTFNKTSGVETQRNVADNADRGTATHTDDGTTVTRPGLA